MMGGFAFRKERVLGLLLKRILCFKTLVGFDNNNSLKYFMNILEHPPNSAGLYLGVEVYLLLEGY